MLTVEDLRKLTKYDSPAWPILLDEATRYGYDDEKVRNLASGFKLGYLWAVGSECDANFQPIGAENVEYTV